ncbi:MAG: InlB B-repeat-containing protein [Opitutales bacterium]
MKLYNISLYKLFMFVACCAATSIATANTVAIGWHSFDGDTATETASYASVGVTGTIVGGVEEIVGSNLDNQTYGDGATFTPAVASTGITANTYSNDNKRVDITVTNGTGSDLSIDAIALDANLIFGSGSVTVSHLSGSSALADGFTGRLLDTLTIDGYTPVQQTVSTSAMDDVVLADGETAAFRIEVVAGDGVTALGVKLDNIAVMTATELEEPPFDDDAVVLAAWADFALTGSSLSSQAPSYTTVGVTANLGKDVNPANAAQGGGQKAEANDGTDGSYGSAYSISAANMDTDNPSALRINNWGNANNQYIDFSITNTTGSDLRLTGIHFDAQTIYSNNRVVDDNGTPDDTSDDVVTSEGTPHSVTVSHFDAVSDLSDGDVTQRTLGTGTSTMNFVPKGNGISLAAMADTILAEGETAAFRLRITNADGAKGHMRIDNLAITGIPAGTIRTLTVDTSAVEAGAGGVDLNGSRKYVDGETVSITATAAEGYTFTGWSGASDSTDATISVTLSADTTLTPNFAAAPTELPTLSISSDGTNVTLTWEGTATLKRADSLSGGFSEVTGATSPHTEAVSGEKFYRLEQ